MMQALDKDLRSALEKRLKQPALSLKLLRTRRWSNWASATTSRKRF